jgi:hypothetical protein
VVRGDGVEEREVDENSVMVTLREIGLGELCIL